MYIARIISLSVLFFTLFAACEMRSCPETKDAFLDEFHDQIKIVRSARLPEDSPRWSDYDPYFEHAIETCYPRYEPEMSGRERRKFWRKATTFYVDRHGKSAAKTFIKDQKKRFHELKRDAVKTSEKELDEIFEDLNEDLEKLEGNINQWLEE